MVTDDMAPAIAHGYDGGRRTTPMPRGGKREGGGRKPKAPDKKMVTMAIVVDPQVRDQLRAVADARGASISSVAQEFIKAGLEALKQTP